MPKIRRFILAILTAGLGALSVQADQYWDSSPTAGFQPGDGYWSTAATDTNWNNGTGNGVQSAWVNDSGSSAQFGENSGTSRIMISSSIITCNLVQVYGQNYTVVQTNGSKFYAKYSGGYSFNLKASNVTWLVAGGSSSATTILDCARGGGAAISVGSVTQACNAIVTVDGGGVPYSAIVTNSGLGSSWIGNFAGSQTCGVNVVNGGYWYGSDLVIGAAGATGCFANVDNGMVQIVGALYLYGNGSRAVVKNSGRLTTSSGGSVSVGAAGVSSNCSLTVDGGTVSTFGSVGTHVYGNNSMLTITNGGMITNGGGGGVVAVIGDTGATNCTAIVAGGSTTQSVWYLAGSTLTIGSTASSVGNVLRVDGGGSPGSAVVRNTGALTVGNVAGANGNGLVVTNGGQLLTGGAIVIGNTGSSGNYAQVVGSTGSLWNVGNQTLTVGYSTDSKYNSLTIDGKGLLGSAIVTNVSALGIGYNGSLAAPSMMNAVIVTNGGVLYLGTGANWGHGALAHAIGVIGNGIFSAPSNRLEIVQGGRVYSSAALFIGFNYYNGPLTGNRLLVRDSDSLLDMRGYGIEAPHSYPQNASCTSGVQLLIDGGVVTNVGGFIMPNRLTGDLLHDNRLIVTNGGKFYMTAASWIGATGGSNNVAVITGSNSLWQLGGAALNVGLAAHSNNMLTIDQGGTVDNIGTLTLAGGVNFVNLRGGTLGAATTTYTNGLFTAGDGTQPATLKSLAGGTLSFTSGLLITNNATLTGVGTVGGAGVGVILTNGAIVNPGINGAGALTISGSNLTWAGGGIYQCEITNLNLGFGVGWDVLNVSSQLLFAGITPKFKIKMDSKGVASGFNPALNYTLKILTYGSMVGYDTNLITLDTNVFSTVPASTWYVTNFNNSLYLAYDGTSPGGDANLVWKAPSNGNWSVAGNWAGGAAPIAGGATSNVLNFGDTGTRYISSNNLAGTFQLNKLVLASISSVTNQICGSNLSFTVDGATTPRVDFQTGGGTFVISNGLSLGTGMVFGGNAGGTLVLASNVLGGQPLVKEGPWTLALAASNQFADPVVVTNVSYLRLDSTNALGTNSLIVSNGGNLINTALLNFGNGSYRSAQVAGSDSLWNNGPLTVGSNAQVTVDGGRLVVNGLLTVADRGTVANSLTVTNGGRITTTSEFCIGTANIGNSALIAAGGQVYSLGNTRVGNNTGSQRNSLVVRGTDALLDVNAQNLYVGYHASILIYSNSMTIADNALVTNCMLSVGGGAACNFNNLLVTNGGKLFTRGATSSIGGSSTSNSVSVVGGTYAPLWNNGGQNLNIGLDNGAGYNSLLIDGSGAGAMVTNVNVLLVGGRGGGSAGGPGNSLQVMNGGILVYGSPGLDGNGMGISSPGAASNTISITTGGKVYARGATTYAGQYWPGNSNTMSICDANSLFDGGGGNITLGSQGNPFPGNLLLINNYGVVTNCAVNVGGIFNGAAYPNWNSLVITNGGKLYGVNGANNVIGGGGAGTYNSVTVNSNSSWNVAGGSVLVGEGTNNTLSILGDGLVTNAASIYVGYNKSGARFNNLIITNGGKLFSTALSGIGHPWLSGLVYGQCSNSAVVTGPNSLWNLGGANLTVGFVNAAGAATGNVLTIDQGGTVDNIGTLTVGAYSNAVNLYGGMLGMVSAVYSNGLFTAGDGAQSATLKALGGTASFPSGLLINTNAILTGVGTVNGGAVGVILTNGATLNPGLAGPGTLTIGGSNLTWNAGATCLVEIVNLVGGAGSGYDTLNVSSQLALVADVGSSSLVIRLSTLGVAAANFSSNASYNLLVASCSSLAGFDATKFKVNTDDFVNPVAGTWGVMRLDSNLYVTYRPTFASGLNYTWVVPSNGNWTVDGNWVGGSAPPASSPGMQLTFGGGASDPYYMAINNNVGSFQLNRLVFTNASAAVTNILGGNPLQFWNAGAAIELGSSGSFNISMALNSTTNLVVGGAGSGMVILTNSTIAGTLTKQGASTAVLKGTNSFFGPLVVNGAGGTLRIDNLNALSTNDITVSNGTLQVNIGAVTFAANNRRIWVTGDGSLVTNTAGTGFTVGTNALVTVANGGRLAIVGALTVADQGTVANSLRVTNGGQVVSTLASYLGNVTSNNSMLVSGGGAQWNGGNQNVFIGYSTGGTNNTLRIDGLGVQGGAQVTNLLGLWVGSTAGSGWNTLIVTNGGQMFGGSPTIGGVSSNNTAVISGGGAFLNGYNGTLTVGSSGTNNTLRIDGQGTVAGARVTNVAAVTVGITAGSGWNTLIVTNGGQLINAGTVTIGSISSNNTAVISGGGALFNLSGNGLVIGSTAGSTNNTVVIDGQNVDGGGLVTNVSNLALGAGGDNNTMLVTNKGQIHLTGSFSIGNTASGSQLIVAQGGKMKGTGLANSYIGTAGGDVNLLLIRDTNTIFDLGTLGSFVYVGYCPANSTSTGNVMRVENGGVFTNGSIRIGGSDITHFDIGNVLLVSNGLVYASGLASSVGWGANSCFGTARVVGASSVWNGGAQAINVGYGARAWSNTLWIDAAVFTNIGGFNLGQAVAQTNSWNLMVVTNGARIYSIGATVIGASTFGTNNTAIVTGTNTVWDQANANLTIGAGAFTTNNILRIDQGATVDNIGTLAVNSNNFLQLLGGTLGVTATTFTNSTLLTIGDGVQNATLKALGGTLAFNGGLLITNKATLTGFGTVGGGGVGVVLTNGAFLNPGISGAGSLVIGGSNLTWNGGAVYTVDITNLNLGAGNGWDFVTVNTQLLFAASVPNYEIRMDSQKSQPVGFAPNMDYNIRIMTVVGTMTGYDPSKITVNTNAFVGGTSPWVVSNVANSLYLVYRGAPAGSSASLTWMVPSNGNWDVVGNWVGNVVPGLGGDPTNILGFGDNGTRYCSTNNRGAFLLNQLQLSSLSAVTNLIAGNPLIFTNNGATLPRMDFLAGAGAFSFSNALILATDTVFGGNAFVGGVVAVGGAITNRGTMTKQGTWTLALSGVANNFTGPLVVDSPDGILRLDNINALNGAGPVTVSNGTLAVNHGAVNYYFANNQHNRSGQVMGSGSVWTNWGSVFSGFSTGSTNVTVKINAGKMVWAERFLGFAYSSDRCNAVVTNGGKLIFTSTSAAMSYSASNSTTVITGTNSLMNCSTLGLVVSGEPTGGAGFGNVLRIENGAMATNISTLTIAGAGSTSNSLTVGNAGKLFQTGNLVIGGGINASSNTFLLTGSNSLWVGSALYCGNGAGAFSNSCVIDDGAMATNIRVILADGCCSNSLVVKNRGKLFSAGGTLHVANNAFASSNNILVTGSGTVWNAGGMIFNVSTSTSNSFNRLSIEEGGVVTNMGVISIAAGLFSSNNSLVVNGGKLFATSVNFNNSLANSMQMDGASEVILAGITITNVNQSLRFNGGRLTVTNALVSNTLACVVGDGFSPATLVVPVGGVNTFMDGLVITNAATLTGQGVILATSTVYGTLSPGVAIGTLTNIGGVTLKSGSVSLFEIASNTVAGSGWDLMVVTNGALTLGGTLKPILTGGFLPTNTQSYMIMTNAWPLGMSGEFFNGGNGAQIAAYSNDLIKVMGAFRLVLSNQCVILNSFLPNSSLQRGTLFRFF